MAKHKTSDFGTVWILEFQIRYVQLVKVCKYSKMHRGIQDTPILHFRKMFHLYGLAKPLDPIKDTEANA